VPRRLLLALFAMTLVAVACSSDDDESSAKTVEGPTIAVTLSDRGCEPRALTTPVGPTNFSVTNSGTSAVTEFEILDGKKIVGEVENVIPGKDRHFSVTLKAGSYTTKCPGGSSFDAGTLVVTS
jgi:iron uptake system component EfeO